MTLSICRPTPIGETYLQAHMSADLGGEPSGVRPDLGRRGRDPDATGAKCASSRDLDMAHALRTRHLVPSIDHEALVELFRSSPELALALLRANDACVDEAVTARAGSIDLSQLVPMELRCDVLIELRDADQRLLAAVIVEVQRGRDPSKRRSWPAYLTSAHARLGCPIQLLVVALEPAVARWSARPIEVGPGFVLHPMVLDAARIPRITAPLTAGAIPELAVLSALAHRDASTAGAALATIRALPDEVSRVYWDLIFAALPRTVQAVLEQTMLKNYVYKSDFARRYIRQGREEGREEGHEEERAMMLRRLLATKFGALTDEAERNIAGASYEELGRYLERLLTADSIASVFDGA